MSLDIDKKQKLMIELLISDVEIFSKAVRVMNHKYFDKPLNRVVEFINTYFQKHKGIPSVDVIEAETGVLLVQREVDYDEVTYALEEIEKFCQESAMSLAIMDSVDLINAGKLSAVSELVRNALLVKIDDAVGTALFDNAEERVNTTEEATDERSIGIKELDVLLNRVRRTEVGVLFGGTGAGKSVTLGNIAHNLSKQGLHGVIITLELKEKLYSKRLDCIFTGVDIAKHKEHGEHIQEVYNENSESYGSVVVKFMKTKSTVSNFRTFLFEYELKYKRKPDFIIIDYLALMGIDGGNELAMGKFDADEFKIFDLQGLATDYNAYLFTAGQLNRDGTDIIDIQPKHVAGGLSVVNGSDWSIAMVATEEDLDNNQFQIKQLKIRNGAKTRKPITLYKCPNSLRISDQPIIGQSKLVEKKTSQKKDTGDKVPSTGNGKEKLKAALNRLNR